VPSCGRAVILGRLGWCLHLGGRPDLAMVAPRRATRCPRSIPCVGCRARRYPVRAAGRRPPCNGKRS
jgi:hypothetical protein